MVEREREGKWEETDGVYIYDKGSELLQIKIQIWLLFVLDHVEGVPVRLQCVTYSTWEGFSLVS